MYLLFEETGKFLAGRMLSEADTSAQVELDSGKRVKVKAANILLKFEKPEPAQLMAAAQAVASGIELEMAWEFASEEEFGTEIQPHEAKYRTSKQPSIRVRTLDLHVTPPELDGIDPPKLCSEKR